MTSFSGGAIPAVLPTAAPEEPASGETLALGPGRPSCQPKPKAAAVCPICSVDLYKKRQELGALSNQGHRIERALYHSGCITLMLAHKGSMLKRPGEGFEISWGLSPISRQPVDGFLKMPSLFNQKAWVSFVDWRNQGNVSVEDLAAAFAAVLPINENDSVQIVRDNFLISDGDVISEGELALRVFPYLQPRCTDLCQGEQVLLGSISKFMQAAEGLRLLSRGIGSIFSLRLASRQALLIAQTILTQDLCRILETSRHLPDERTIPTALDCVEAKVAASLGLMAPQGDARSIRVLGWLLEHEDEAIRDLAFEAMLRVAGQESLYARAEVSARTHHASPQVRVAAINLLAMMLHRGDTPYVEVIISRIEDSAPSVRIAAVKTLEQLCDKGDQRAINALVNQIGKDKDDECREVVEEVLLVIAKGDHRTIEKFYQDVMSEDEEWRVQALKVLGGIADLGDIRVIRRVLHVFGTAKKKANIPNVIGKSTSAPLIGSGKVQSMAILTLGKLAVPGRSQNILRAICPATHDTADCQVADAAIRTIAQVATSDDWRAARVLATVFCEEYRTSFQGPAYRVITLRFLALDSLERLAQDGKQGYAFSIISSLCRDKDVELRKRAVASIGRVSRRADADTVRFLNDLIEKEKDANVKDVAKRSLQSVGQPPQLPLACAVLYMSGMLGMLGAGVASFIVAVFILRELLRFLGLTWLTTNIVAILIPVFVGMGVRFRRRLFYRFCPSCFKVNNSPRYDQWWWAAWR